MKKQSIYNKESVFIIAEMAWSHDGSVDNAQKIIKGAAEAKADAVSFHITDVSSYMVKDYGRTSDKSSFAWQTLAEKEEKTSVYDYLEKLNLKEKDWGELFPFARNLGLKICAMPNDNKSLELCKRLSPDYYVVGPACFGDEDFVAKIAGEKKPVILRIGGAAFSEIKETVDLIKKNGNQEIILLHGIQLYPTKIEDINLRLIPCLEKTFEAAVGLADHIDGDSELALIVPLLALPLGAKVIEKHLTYNRDFKGEDYEAALDPEGFKKFVRLIREAEKSLGDSYFKELSEAEIKYRELSKKRIVALRDIKKGEKITKENIAFKRANEGIFLQEIKKIIGKIANYDIKKDTPILWEKVK
ncbi:MAG: N-acetylneuraminate synthase family protein [bacterium]|nr:N-acetylneuraminate synthase family protein [bacterium]